MEFHSADLLYAKDTIMDIAATVLRLCPLSYEMEGNGHQGWQELVDLGESTALAPLRKTIFELSRDRFVTSAPLREFLAGTAREIPPATFLAASEQALKCQYSHPAGSFLLAHLSLLGWIYGRDTIEVYRIRDGHPNPGWLTIPYVCASTLATKTAGGYWSARQIVREARSVLSLTKAKTASVPEVDHAAEKYRALEKKISLALENDIADLAEDIRDACRPIDGNWRAEIGAITWTLGQVPESRMFKGGSTYLPSLQFFRRLVRASLTAIPSDPLCQYIWLELKDRPPCNLRDHRSLFAVMNGTYYHRRLESGPIPLAQIFARAAIELFKEQIDNEAVQLFYGTFNPFSEPMEMVDTAADMRIAALALEISNSNCEAGRQLRPFFTENFEETCAVTMKLAEKMMEDSVLYPEWPDSNNFANAILHEMVERKLSLVEKNDLPLADLRTCIAANEELRTAAMQYWLMVTLPLPTPDEDATLREQLEEDLRLRRTLRSAYFLSRWHVFPHHYRLFSVITRDPDMIRGFQDQMAVPTDAETGRDRYRKAREELKELIEEMEQIAPLYASKRRIHSPSMERILGFLSAHRQNSLPE